MNMETLDHIKLGEGCIIDNSAILGYLPERNTCSIELSVGNEARIRSGSVIYGGSSIGAGLETGHNVVIREENTIGDYLRIWNNSTIDYGCYIGSRVKIHCNCYICQFSTIEDDVFISPGVNFANDIHPVCTRCMKGPTIKKGARIGMGAIILPYVTVGAGALVASGALVTQDVPPESVVMGNPALLKGSVYDLECRFEKDRKPYGI